MCRSVVRNGRFPFRTGTERKTVRGVVRYGKRYGGSVRNRERYGRWLAEVYFLLQIAFSLPSTKAPVTKRQWSALVSAIQSATMERITLEHLDLTDVEMGQINQILGASCLEVVSLEWCLLPTASTYDAFLTHCRDIGVTRLTIYGNDVADGRSLSVSEEAIFDYCFRAGRRHSTSLFYLRLSMVQISNSFLRRFVEVVGHTC